MIRQSIYLSLCLCALGSINLSVSAQTAASPVSPQNAQTSGLSFANSLMPTQGSQLVNPQALNQGAWTSSNNQAALPSFMGAFSKPSDGSQYAGFSYQNGLSNLGLQAQNACANHTSSADPVSDQYCAAVNFLAGQCVVSNSVQTQVLGSANTANPTSLQQQSQVANGYCTGSYGQGANQFNYQDISANSPSNAFISSYRNAQLNLNQNQTAASCSDPGSVSSSNSAPNNASYSSYTCWLSSSVSTQQCSQNLGVNVTQVINAPLQNNTCTSGVLSGDTCISTQTSDPLEVSSCPSGFNLNADQCVQNVSLPADATPICLNGALWSVQSQSCVQSTQVVSAANQSFGACPSGMIFDVDQCIQSNTQTAQVVGYSCPSNSQLTGTSCSEYEQTTLAPTELLNCSTDEQLINNQCVSSSTSQATALYSCPSGSTLSNQSCSTTISQPQSMQLSCNGVGTLSSYLPPSMPFKCYQFASDFGCQIFAYYLSLSYVNTDTSSGQSVCVYGPVLVLECPSGTEFNGVACLQTTVTEASIAGYECAVGVLSNGVCTVTTSSAALISYVCPAQSQLINNNGEYQCTATTTTITPATPSYSCSPGYQLSGTQCTQTTYTPALINFSCNAPAVLVGQNCVSEMTVVSTALMSYSCPAGFNLSGTACTTQQSTDPLIQWTCPSGFQLQSSSSSSLMQCTKVVTQAALVTLYCSSGQQLVNSSCVQYTAQTNWSDGCAAFEQSAGQPLPALQ